MINGHGDDGYLYQNKIQVNFSSNAYYGLQLEPLFRHLNTRWQSLRTYPEPLPRTAERKLAESMHILPEEVCMTNGATEAIYLIAQAFCGRNSCILVPTFTEYADACRIHRHKVTLLYSLERIPADTDIVWLCNPNNPTGEVIPLAHLEELAGQHSRTLFVIDQSYEDFTEERLYTARNAACHPNLILLHSMTKRYGLPGLRIGYLTACEKLTEQIRRIRMPWPVNQMAVEALYYLLEHESDFAFDLPYILKERARVSGLLEKKGIATVWESRTNFLLARLRMGHASALKEYLAEEHGMLIRDASNFDGLDKQYFRIAVQSAEEDDRLVHAMEEWLWT